MRTVSTTDFISNRLPGATAKVEVLCTGASGQFVAPFLCTWSDAGWVHADTKRPVGAEIVGWREFRGTNHATRLLQRVMQIQED